MANGTDQRIVCGYTSEQPGDDTPFGLNEAGLSKESRPNSNDNETAAMLKLEANRGASANFLEQNGTERELRAVASG
jgi:hypothetical protein